MKKYKECAKCGKKETKGAYMTLLSDDGKGNFERFQVCPDCVLNEWEQAYGVIIDEARYKWMFEHGMPGFARMVIITASKARPDTCARCHGKIADRFIVAEYVTDESVTSKTICYDCIKKTMKEKHGRDVDDAFIMVEDEVLLLRRLIRFAEKMEDKDDRLFVEYIMEAVCDKALTLDEGHGYLKDRLIEKPNKDKTPANN